MLSAAQDGEEMKGRAEVLPHASLVAGKWLSYSSDQDPALHHLNLAWVSAARSHKMPFVTLANPELGIPGNAAA